jgi:hypothetical protein
MLALAIGPPGPNQTLVLIIVAAVILAIFWRIILKAGIAILIIGFAFLLVTGVLDLAHRLHALFS